MMDNIALNNKEREIVNYLKLRKFDRANREIELVSDVEVAAVLEIDKGVPAIRGLLQSLEAKGIVKKDRYNYWGISKRVDLKATWDLEERQKKNDNPIATQIKSNTPKQQKDGFVSPTTKINLIKRNGRTYAAIEDLRKHPLNSQIYSSDNISDLKEKIRKFRRIKTLVITPEGKIISGNSRFECGLQLGWKILPVEVRRFKTELDELEALLLENASRHKSIEEIARESLFWEKIEKERAKQRQVIAAISTNKKLDREVDINDNTLWMNSSEPSRSNKQSSERARDRLAKKAGMGWQKLDRAKKIVLKIDKLRDRGLNGAADDLRKTMNHGSVNAANNKLKQLKKLEKTLETLDKDKDELFSDLEYTLSELDINNAVDLIRDKKLEDRSANSDLAPKDVVKIKSKLGLNQWGVVSGDYFEDFTCNVLVHQGGLAGVHKAELEVLELSDRQKEKALKVMMRMQFLWSQLNELGLDYQIGRDMLKSISTKSSPILNEMETGILNYLEEKTKELLIRKVNQPESNLNKN